jgi:hypothetical protein
MTPETPPATLIFNAAFDGGPNSPSSGCPKPPHHQGGGGHACSPSESANGASASATQNGVLAAGFPVDGNVNEMESVGLGPRDYRLEHEAKLRADIVIRADKASQGQSGRGLSTRDVDS